MTRPERERIDNLLRYAEEMPDVTQAYYALRKSLIRLGGSGIEGASSTNDMTAYNSKHYPPPPKLTKEQRMLYLFGLPFILGEVWCDILIDAYFNESGPHDFGFWLNHELTDAQFDALLKTPHKEAFVLEWYEKYCRKECLYPDEIGQDFKAYLSKRHRETDIRWALEKQANGGFTTMDYYTLNPEELHDMLKESCEQAARGDVISSEEVMRRMRERLNLITGEKEDEE
jgi:hypothetical protein